MDSVDDLKTQVSDQIAVMGLYLTDDSMMHDSFKEMHKLLKLFYLYLESKDE